jgi:Acetyltransferase (GNAT) domain
MNPAASTPLSGEPQPAIVASASLDAHGMRSALARLEKHGLGGGFECQVDSVCAAAWDEIAGEFNDLNYDQIARYSAGQWGERVSHLLLRRHGVPAAGARVAVIRLPGFSRGLAFLRFGPFWRRRDQAPDIAVYRAAIGALVQEYCMRRGHFLTVIPRPNPEFYQRECEVLSEFGFSVRRRFPDPNRYLVDLSLDEEAQRQSLDQKWRYNLRQATANGFDIRLGENDADMRSFQSLHAGMVTRKGFYNADMVHLLPELAAQLPEALRPRIVLALHQGRAVVGAAIALLGDTAYYVFGGSDSASLSLKGGYALHWWIVRWLSTQNVRWYDLGGEAGEPGLRQFKKGLAGKRGAVVRMNGEYDYWAQSSARLIGDAVYGLRAIQRGIRRWRYG